MFLHIIPVSYSIEPDYNNCHGWTDKTSLDITPTQANPHRTKTQADGAPLEKKVKMKDIPYGKIKQDI